MAKIAFIWAYVPLVVAVSIVRSEDCPILPTRENQSRPYPLNVLGNETTKKSEFLCDFIWTQKEHLKKKLYNRMTKRQKSFVRFTVPVIGYNNPYLDMSSYNGSLTWVWVVDLHDYMLYYPHNFIVISTKTMGIITQDWAIDYLNKSPVSLEGFGLDRKMFDTHDIVGYCDPGCVEINKSCGIGKYELQDFLENVTGRKENFEWTWLCLQAHYDVKDIVSVPQFAFPDLLYYWRFLWMFLARRPWFGFMKSKTDFPHYYCYNREDKCEVKELLKHYWVIVAIGLILWLYSPLLVHYLPSSCSIKRKDKTMFPSYKSPIYFGRWVKSLLCFYTEKWYWIRGRRLIFLLAMALTSFRLFYPPYRYYSLFLLLCAVAASLKPTYLSTYVSAELPTHFFLWDLPRGLVRAKPDLVEYQQLAHVMQERLYLSVDLRFWKFLVEKSFHSFILLLSSRHETSCCAVVVLGFFTLRRGCLIFVAAFVGNLVFYFIPLPYFCMALYHAVWKGRSQYIETVRAQSSRLWLQVNVIASLFHSMILFFLLTYILIVTFIWCYAISEFTMFTFIGGALTASMGFQYFLLVGAFVTAMYTLVRNLHEGYDRILEETVKMLKDKDDFDVLARQVSSESKRKFILEKEQNSDEKKFTVVVRKMRQTLPYCRLIFHDGITTYVNRDMFDFVVERCRPLRRQVLFIVIKVIAIIFYSVIAMWVKNVYHMEEKVGSIFNMVKSVAVSFLPGALQFISYKSHFGKKTDVVLKQDVYESLVKYISQNGS